MNVDRLREILQMYPGQSTVLLDFGRYIPAGGVSPGGQHAGCVIHPAVSPHEGAEARLQEWLARLNTAFEAHVVAILVQEKPYERTTDHVDRAMKDVLKKECWWPEPVEG